MSKVANYLRSHLTGEVSTRTDVRAARSSDAGVLAVSPELVVLPRNNADIRKVARFAWQIAEKGHVIPITARGKGAASVGGAIGKGIVIDMSRHMNRIFEYEPKQHLVRVQPGASVRSLNESLGLQGVGVAALLSANHDGTVGGAIATNQKGALFSRYGGMSAAVEQLEVVLASGDVLQTGRVSKRELNRRKGLPGFEGDIYRGIDNIITDNKDLVAKLDAMDGTGYSAIAQVKQKDGSFDLTPLFCGSEGTLGIIDEVILRAEFFSFHQTVAAMVFASAEAARDAVDEIKKLEPARLEYVDSLLFEEIRKAGKRFSFYEAAQESFAPQAVLIVSFDDFNSRRQAHKLKKLMKLGAKTDAVISSAEDEAASELIAALDVVSYYSWPDTAAEAAPRLFEGFYVPRHQFEDFVRKLSLLGSKLRLELPIAGHADAGVYGVYPRLSLKKVGDKQKIFKLLDELSKLVDSHEGHFVCEGGEGRLKTKIAQAGLDPAVAALYSDIKKVFDPYNIMNPGVKTDNDIRTVTSMLRDSFSTADLLL